MFRITVYLLIFWAMQVIAQLFFKWGSMSDSRWLWGFFAGNLFGFSSIWLLMHIYRGINPNVALGLATVGAFLLSQIALTLAFKTRVTPVQWIGIITIMVGIIALTVGGPKETGTNIKQVTTMEKNEYK